MSARLSSTTGDLFIESEKTFVEELSRFLVNLWLCFVGYIFVNYFDCGVGYILNGFRVNNRDNFLRHFNRELIFIIDIAVRFYIVFYTLLVVFLSYINA